MSNEIELKKERILEIFKSLEDSENLGELRKSIENNIDSLNNSSLPSLVNGEILHCIKNLFKTASISESEDGYIICEFLAKILISIYDSNTRIFEIEMDDFLSSDEIIKKLLRMSSNKQTSNLALLLIQCLCSTCKSRINLFNYFLKENDFSFFNLLKTNIEFDGFDLCLDILTKMAKENIKIRATIIESSVFKQFFQCVFPIEYDVAELKFPLSTYENCLRIFCWYLQDNPEKSNIFIPSIARLIKYLIFLKFSTNKMSQKIKIISLSKYLLNATEKILNKNASHFDFHELIFKFLLELSLVFTQTEQSVKENLKLNDKNKMENDAENEIKNKTENRKENDNVIKAENKTINKNDNQEKNKNASETDKTTNSIDINSKASNLNNLSNTSDLHKNFENVENLKNLKKLKIKSLHLCALVISENFTAKQKFTSHNVKILTKDGLNEKFAVESIPAVLFCLYGALSGEEESTAYEAILAAFFKANLHGKKMASETFYSAMRKNVDEKNEENVENCKISFGKILSGIIVQFYNRFGLIKNLENDAKIDQNEEENNQNETKNVKKEIKNEEKRRICSALRILTYIISKNSQIKIKMLSAKLENAKNNLPKYLPRALFEILLFSDKNFIENNKNSVENNIKNSAENQNKNLAEIKATILALFTVWFSDCPKAILVVFRAPQKYFLRFLKFYMPIISDFQNFDKYGEQLNNKSENENSIKNGQQSIGQPNDGNNKIDNDDLNSCKLNNDKLNNDKLKNDKTNNDSAVNVKQKTPAESAILFFGLCLLIECDKYGKNLTFPPAVFEDEINALNQICKIKNLNNAISKKTPNIFESIIRQIVSKYFIEKWLKNSERLIKQLDICSNTLLLKYSESDSKLDSEQSKNSKNITKIENDKKQNKPFLKNLNSSDFNISEIAKLKISPDIYNLIIEISKMTKNNLPLFLNPKNFQMKIQSEKTNSEKRYDSVNPELAIEEMVAKNKKLYQKMFALKEKNSELEKENLELQVKLKSFEMEGVKSVCLNRDCAQSRIREKMSQKDKEDLLLLVGKQEDRIEQLEFLLETQKIDVAFNKSNK